jgi:phosphoglycolate phosphatase-like HAD superfamily hydrolase
MDLIKTLKNNKFYLSVASTGSLAHVETALKTSGIYSEFESIHCNETIKVRMVEEITENGSKGNWLIIGDRENDFNAGRLNDIITIGVKYGFGTESELMKFDCNINYPSELLTLLGM